MSVSHRPVLRFLPGLFEVRCRMSESGFETDLIMERGKRWDIKNKIEKVERKLKYMLSDDKISNLPFQSFRHNEL